VIGGAAAGDASEATLGVGDGDEDDDADAVDSGSIDHCPKFWLVMYPSLPSSVRICGDPKR